MTALFTAAITFAAAFGLLGFVYFLSRLAGPAAFALLAAIAALAWILPPRRTAAPHYRFSHHDWALALATAAALAAGFSAVLSFDLPHGDWDAWSIWNLRARLLAGPDWRHAVSPALRSHPDYPLLLSSAVAALTPLNSAAARWIGLACFAAVPLLLLAALALLRGPTAGLLASLVLAAGSGWITQGASQYADIPLSLFLLAALSLALLAADPANRRCAFAAGFFAACAAWTKNEGIVFALGFIAAGLLWDRAASGWRIAAGALPGLAVVALFKFACAPPSEYAGQSLAKLADPSRWSAILTQAAREAWNWGNGIGHPLILLALLAFAFRFTRPAAPAWNIAATAVAIQILGDLIAYLLTPAALEWQLATSMNRLFAQLWPSLLLLFFTALRPPAVAATPPPEEPQPVGAAAPRPPRKRSAGHRATPRAALAALLLTAATASAEWKAGAAKIAIDPSEPILLSGYGYRTQSTSSRIQSIYVKAAAFQDDTGALSVITTSDLVGLDVPSVNEISRRAQRRWNIPRERLVLNYSHNHSAPVTGEVLHLYYTPTPDQSAAIARYTARLHDWYEEAIGKAVAALAPARLEFDQGLAGFAVNRRRSRPGGRSLPGPVDHDVPVLAVKSPQGQIRAILFGYSCHPTALSGNTVNGDYPGFAQQALEDTFPGATALFVMGCGGDANPLPRVMGVDTEEAIDLARMYGRILAKSAELVIRAGKMAPVDGPLRAAYATAEIPFQKAPTREELLARRQSQTGAARRYTEHLLAQLERDGRLPDRYPYPVQAWRFGSSLTFIALTGENVVDYCLRFKREYGWDNTWVAGYNNELLSYIPSLRVLKEGGYEGTEGMAEYGHPAPYGWAVEERIAEKVDELVRRVRR